MIRILQFPTIFALLLLAAGQTFAGELTIVNPSFEEECSADSKLGNWVIVQGAGGVAWARWDKPSGGVMAADGDAFLYTNSTAAAVVQLLKDAPIQAGKYVFSMEVATPAGGPGVENVSPRGVQMAVYAIPTALEKEPRFTLIAEKTILSEAMGRDEQWKPLEVAFEIPANSPFIGQFFQINITSAPLAPNAPEPSQVDIDNVQAKRLD